jgi:M6 family metalloprotease-like protein
MNKTIITVMMLSLCQLSQASPTRVPFDPGVNGPQNIHKDNILAPSTLPQAGMILNSDPIDTTAEQNLNLCGDQYQRDYPLLVIALEYNNISIINSDDIIKSKFFASENSVKDYYDESTNGAINIIEANEGNVNGFLKIKLDKDHPAQTASTIDEKIAFMRDDIKLAIKKISDDQLFDLSKFNTDESLFLSSKEIGLHFIIAGYEEAYSSKGIDNAIWAHKTSVFAPFDGGYVESYSLNGEIFKNDLFNTSNNIFSIGLPAHELGHLLFCLPDLYEENEYPHSGVVEDFGLMGSGSWGKKDFINISGSSPSHLSSWSLLSMNLFDINEFEKIDYYSETMNLNYNDLPSTKIFHIDESSYLLLEGRGKTGYDQSLANQGLVITEVKVVENKTKINLFNKDVLNWGSSFNAPLQNIDQINLSNDVVISNGVDLNDQYQFNVDIKSEHKSSERHRSSGSLFYLLLPLLILMGYRKK